MGAALAVVAGLERIFNWFFPKAVRLLDFYHAKEHVGELAHALYGDDESARQTWLDEACHRLKHEGRRVAKGRGKGETASLQTLAASPALGPVGR